jgi:hypothetical protein
MRRIHLFSMVALAGVLALGIAGMAAHAEDAPAKPVGSISGKVVDKDGNPVAAARVNVIVAPKVAEANKQADEPTTKPAKPESVGKTTTADDGTFSIKDIPVGKYVVVAGKKNVGQGREKAEVTEGKDTAVTITLKAAAPK